MLCTATCLSQQPPSFHHGLHPHSPVQCCNFPEARKSQNLSQVGYVFKITDPYFSSLSFCCFFWGGDNFYIFFLNILYYKVLVL